MFTRSSARQQITVRTKEMSIPCERTSCNKRFATRYEMNSHYFYEHKDHGSVGPVGRFQCDWPQCGRVFRYKPQMDSHKNLHVTAKVMDFAPNDLLKNVCQQCGEKPADGQSLSQHMATAHKNGDQEINIELLEPEVQIKTELIVPDNEDFDL